MRFTEYTNHGWQPSEDFGSMLASNMLYDLERMTNRTLSSLFPTYDWYTHDGRGNLGDWIEQAALEAGH